MERFRKIMGRSSTSSTSSSSSTSTSHRINSSSSGASSSSHQKPGSSAAAVGSYQSSNRNYPEAEKFQQIPGLDLGSGKMTVSKSGRWKKKERRRLGIWEEEQQQTNPTSGVALDRNATGHAGADSSQQQDQGNLTHHQQGHLIFKELGRRKAPHPPSSFATRIYREEEQRRSLEVQQQHHHHQQQRLPDVVRPAAAMQHTHHNPDYPPMDDADIAGFMDEFDATLQVYENESGSNNETHGNPPGPVSGNRSRDYSRTAAAAGDQQISRDTPISNTPKPKPRPQPRRT